MRLSRSTLSRGGVNETSFPSVDSQCSIACRRTNWVCSNHGLPDRETIYRTRASNEEMERDSAINTGAEPGK